MSEDHENKKSFGNSLKKVLSYIFIDGLSGMATGLFCTLIIGTIIGQVGTLIARIDLPFFVGLGSFINLIGNFAKILMGAGIGLGMAFKFKKTPLVSISAAVAGMIGAYASQILNQTVLFAGSTALYDTVTGELLAEFRSLTALSSVGEPLGAFVAAFVALEIGSLVAGKTKVDIIVTPLVAILSGAVVGLLIGPPISEFMRFLGSVISAAAEQQPILMGILVAALMGIALTLPISSAAIGVSLGLSGIAAGAAVVGCCCQMIGFAVMSFKENRWSGLFAQGLGTSMLQMPNLVKHPLCWLPPVISSVILGPLAAATVYFGGAFNGGFISNAVGSGMGTAGLVGPISTFFTMTENGTSVWLTLILIALFCFVLPALLTFAISLLFRKFNLIKDGDLSLEL
ncbi:MAG: PTS sugar transporter subunit IIC [Clostridia bacterium]|nr:PTS sugar transporter subunit IIC [Clostridia bacterium]